LTHRNLYLYNQIVARFPSYPTVSEWEKINMVRKWVAEKLVVSNSEFVLDGPGSHFYERDALSLLYLFEKELGGVWCAGACYFLYATYRELCIETVVLHTGPQPFWTHAVTLAQADGKWYVQDAYANLTFLRLNGSPLTYEDLLLLLKEKQIHKIKVQKDDCQRLYIVTKKKWATWDQRPFTNVREEKDRIKGNISVRRIQDDIDRVFLKEEKVIRFLKKGNLDLNLINIYLFPYWVDGDHRYRVRHMIQKTIGIRVKLRDDQNETD